MTKVSELAESILAKKYYQVGEDTPEDVFMRVAKVMAIPDIAYLIYKDMKEFDSSKVTEAVTCKHLADIFSPYQETYFRSLDRVGKENKWARTLANQLVSVGRDYKKLWEEKTQIYYDMMHNLDFMPATPVLMNAGKEGKKGMLSSCFFLDIEDSLIDIFSKVKDVAWISKLGGGVGLDVSNLRPEGFPVKGTNGNSSGPISFLRVFNETGNTVEQGGARRAALMAAMSITHPDIVKFIKSKKEEGELKNFNISVLVTDKFIQTLNDDPDKLFVAMFNSKEFYITKISGKPVPCGSINCVKDPDYNICSGEAFYSYKDLWNFIIKNAWGNGEPGILFDDRLQEGDVFGGKYGKLMVNPCVAESTWVATADGYRQVSDLISSPFTAIVDGAKFPASAFHKTGHKKLLKLDTKEGFNLELTANHLVKKVLSTKKVRDPNNYNGTQLTEYYEDWIPAGELQAGDKIRLHNHENFEHWKGGGSFSEGYLLGMLVGDGHITKDGRGAIEIWGGPEAEDLKNVILNCVRSMKKRADFNGFYHNKKDNKYTLRLSAIRKLGEKFNIVHGNKHITQEIEKASSNFYCGFLSGIFDADGSVQGTQRKGVSIRLSQSSQEDLQAIQRMLLRLSIYSKIYKRRDAGKSMLPDSNGELKEYCRKAQFELIISGESIIRFKERVGFYHSGRSQKLKNSLFQYKRKPNRTEFVATVCAMQDIGEEDVYDATVDGVHAFDGNGFYLHNCGELPLLDSESCNLGAINLLNMYDEKKDAIDYPKLEKTIRQAVTFLDNTLDVNFFPLDRIEESSLRGRKIGLGTMGLHDLMLKFKIRYGGEGSLSLINNIYSFIRKIAIDQSERLGRERGIPDALQEIDSKQRNSALLTVQPTGTVSLIAGCSSGIEPNFKWTYPRKDSYGTHIISHPILNEIKEGDHPDWLVSALEVSPSDHIAVQAQVQKHIDLSIAKTINLSNDAAEKDISNAYLLAYELGCKSTTVYRTGSREEEVLCSDKDNSLEKKEPEENVVEVAPQLKMRRERPPVLFGATYRVKTPGGTAYITINEDDDGVRECFISVSKAGSEIGSHVASQGRLISNSLQWNVPIHTIINHLKGQKSSPVWADGELINSVPDAVARKLEHFIRNFEGFSEFIDKTTVCVKVDNSEDPRDNISGEICSECGEILYMESGCNICKSCGYSRCGS